MPLGWWDGRVLVTSVSIQRIIRRAEEEGSAISAVSAGWSHIREVTHMAVVDVSEDLWLALQRDEPQFRPLDQ